MLELINVFTGWNTEASAGLAFYSGRKTYIKRNYVAIHNQHYTGLYGQPTHQLANKPKNLEVVLFLRFASLRLCIFISVELPGGLIYLFTVFTKHIIRALFFLISFETSKWIQNTRSTCKLHAHCHKNGLGLVWELIWPKNNFSRSNDLHVSLLRTSSGTNDYIGHFFSDFN